MNGIRRPTEDAALSAVYARRKLAQLKAYRPLDRLIWLMRMSGWTSTEIGELIDRRRQTVSVKYVAITKDLTEE